MDGSAVKEDHENLLTRLCYPWTNKGTLGSLVFLTKFDLSPSFNLRWAYTT